MANAHLGAEARFRMRQATTWGTLPTGNWNALNFYSETIGSGQSLVDDPELGAARFTAMDSSQPGVGLPSVQGAIVVPLDLAQIGWWLVGLMGPPVTTGTTNFIHTFTSGSASPPFFGMEFALVPSGTGEHKQVNSACVTGLELDFTDAEGFFRATASIIARNVARAQASAAGTPPATPARAKVPATRGLVRFNGVTAANILGGTFSYQNQQTGERYVDGNEFIGEADSGIHTARTNLRIRLRKSQLAVLDLFNGTTPFACELEFSIDANRSLVLTMPNCIAPTTVPTIDGPGGLEVPVEIGAFQSATQAMMVAVLRNQVASFA